MSARSLKSTAESGSILLFTTIMLMVSVGIIAAMLEHILIYLHAIKQHQYTQDHYYAMEATANLAAKESGISGYADPDTAIARLRQTQNQRYIVENLGVFPCIRIVNSTQGTEHVRVTVLADNRILQVRFARLPQQEVPADCEAVTYVKPGVISVRLI